MNLTDKSPLPLKHSQLMRACYAMLIVIVLLTAVVLYQVTHQRIPDYSAIYKDNTGWHRWRLKNLTTPIIRRDVILERAALAAVSAYSFNAADYQAQVEKVSQEFFTSNGGEAYLQSLQDSGVRDAVLNKGLVVSAVVQSQAVILQQGLLVGRYSWKVQVPIMVAFQSPSNIKQQRYIVNMLIIYADTRRLARGIGIDQFKVVKV